MSREIVFVGGLSSETTDEQLEYAFKRFGKVIEAQIIRDSVTDRSRGFGFVTFPDQCAVFNAVAEMDGVELGGRVIIVNKFHPKFGLDDPDYGGWGYSSGGRGGYGGGGVDRPPPVGRSICFECGRPGHCAWECPFAGGGGNGSFSSCSRFDGGGNYGDCIGGADCYGDRYMDHQYDVGYYGDRDRLVSRGSYQMVLRVMKEKEDLEVRHRALEVEKQAILLENKKMLETIEELNRLADEEASNVVNTKEMESMRIECESLRQQRVDMITTIGELQLQLAQIKRERLEASNSLGDVMSKGFSTLSVSMASQRGSHGAPGGLTRRQKQNTEVVGKNYNVLSKYMTDEHKLKYQERIEASRGEGSIAPGAQTGRSRMKVAS